MFCDTAAAVALEDRVYAPYRGAGDGCCQLDRAVLMDDRKRMRLGFVEEMEGLAATWL